MQGSTQEKHTPGNRAASPPLPLPDNPAMTCAAAHLKEMLNSSLAHKNIGFSAINDIATFKGTTGNGS